MIDESLPIINDECLPYSIVLSHSYLIEPYRRSWAHAAGMHLQVAEENLKHDFLTGWCFQHFIEFPRQCFLSMLVQAPYQLALLFSENS